MSQENVDALRRAHSAGRGHDPEALLRMLAPDIVWDLTRSSFPEAGKYRGIDGVREWLRGMDEAFKDVHYEIEETTDLGGDRVLAVLRTQGHGQFSNLSVDYRFASVWTFRGGKVVRMDRFDNRDQALEAVGLRE